MRKKVLAALLAAAVAGTTVMAGTAVFAAENTEGAKAAGGNITIAETTDPQNINPLYVVDQTSFDMMQALYSPFFEIVNGEMYYGNGLCESVTANDDASEFTLKLKKLAEENNIPLQHEPMGGRTGTDADELATAGRGIKMALLSIPLRSMHTVAETIDPEDAANTARLMALAAKEGF